jgi:hypothetical protein
MKRALQETTNDGRSLFGTLPDEILRPILVTVHHTISHHNTVCKHHYRLLMTYDAWLKEAIANYPLNMIFMFGRASIIARRVIEILDTLLEAVKKEPAYRRYANAWAYRMNTKIRALSMPGRYYEETPLAKMMIDHYGDMREGPLKYVNFHPRDFLINFTEDGHVYSLVVREEGPTGRASFRIVQSPKLDETEATDDGDGAPMPGLHEKKYPDKYSERYRLLSTTTDIHMQFPAFNEPVVIARMRRRKKWHDPAQNKYFGMTDEAISAEWERIRSDASKKGTAMHLNLERCYNDQSHETTSKEFSLFREFECAHVNGKLKPFRTEWVMHHDALHLCGSADIIFAYLNDDVPLEFYDPMLNPCPRKKHLVLGDYKRSKAINHSPFMSHDADEEEIKEWYGNVPCTAMLSNCNAVHYACQMCYYKEYLEEHYEIIIDEMFLIILHPQQLTYMKVVIRAEHMAPFMPAIFKHRCDSLLKPL